MAERNALAKFVPGLALLLGLLLASLVWRGGPVALVGVVLAQPALALAVSWWRGTRLRLPGQAWTQEALSLLLVWAAENCSSRLLPCSAMASTAWPIAPNSLSSRDSLRLSRS